MSRPDRRTPGRLVIVGAGHAHLEVIRRLGRTVAAGHEATVVTPDDFWYSGLATGMLGGQYEVELDRVDVADLAARVGARLVRDEVVAVDPAVEGGPDRRRPGTPVRRRLARRRQPGADRADPGPGGGRLHGQADRPAGGLAGRPGEAARPRRRPGPPAGRRRRGDGRRGRRQRPGPGGAVGRRRPARRDPRRRRATACSPASPRAPAAASAGSSAASGSTSGSGRRSSPSRTARRSRRPAIGSASTCWSRRSAWCRRRWSAGSACRRTGPGPCWSTTASARWPRRASSAGATASGSGAATCRGSAWWPSASRRSSAHNLRAALEGRRLRRYRPQRRFLLILNLGDGTGLARWGPLWRQGRSMLRWKEHLDADFLRRYR